MWPVLHIERYALERSSIDALAADSPWLTKAQWRFDADKLLFCVDADLQIGETVRPVILTYPDVFPSAPPSIRPRDTDERWSNHQYGRGGELCLEHRPDNWVGSTTGAEMLLSAYRLLIGEIGVDDAGRQLPVPSAHQISLGQELRGETWRFVLTNAFLQRLEHIQLPQAGHFVLRLRGGTALACVVKLDGTEGTDWMDSEIPLALEDKGSSRPGYVLSIASDDSRHSASRAGKTQSAKELRDNLLGNDASEFTESEILVINRGENIRAVYLAHEKDAIWEFALVPPDPGTRLPPSHAALAEKSVGLLGCGSVGSKVASMLARAGTHKFVLVDDDVLRPENLVRNELDWEDVGVHKADAVASRVKLLRPHASVDVRRQRLGGQESGGSFAGVMTALSRCDLIIDASGDDTAFNYAADIAGRYARPMVWAKVFGGGFGGMLVRSRPGVDPSPQVARARIEQWCTRLDVPP